MDTLRLIVIVADVVALAATMFAWFQLRQIHKELEKRQKIEILQKIKIAALKAGVDASHILKTPPDPESQENCESDEKE